MTTQKTSRGGFNAKFLRALVALVLALAMVPISPAFAEESPPGDSTSPIVQEESTLPGELPLDESDPAASAEELADPAEFATLEEPTVAEEADEAVEVLAGASYWDGTTYDTSWYNTADATFTLTTAAQFAGFAQIVNNKPEISSAGAVTGTDPSIPADDFLGKTVALGTDVDLGAVFSGGAWSGNVWPIIGYYTSSSDSADGTVGRPFKGTFDGGMNNISHLYIPYDVNGGRDNDPSGNSHALFGDLGQGAVVMNVVIASGFVQGARFTAGIVGRSWGDVHNCMNFANIEANGRGGGGGIVGSSYNNGSVPTVINCANFGQVHNVKSSTPGSPFPGGIVAQNEGTIDSCLNVGEVTSGGVPLGGIVGESAGGSIINSYAYEHAAPRIIGTDSGGTVDALSGLKPQATLIDPSFIAILNGADSVWLPGDPFIIDGWPFLDGFKGLPATMLYGGETVSIDGIYQLAPIAKGDITLAPGVVVEIIGNGIVGAAANPAGTDVPNKDLTFIVGNEAELTINNMWIENNEALDDNGTPPPVGVSIIDIVGAKGTVYIKGQNILESTKYVQKAAIHVGPTSELILQGDADSALYFYKNSQGSGIGGNAGEQSGTIRFQSGNYYIKGSKTGAVIGNDSATDAAGPIFIEGGTLYIEANARGAAIGGSPDGIAGVVTQSGGMVYIWCDWQGSAIGASTAAKAGSYIANGGSLKVVVGSNAATYWGTPAGENTVSEKPITADKQDSQGNLVSCLTFDASAYADSTSPITVNVDGLPFYTGLFYNFSYTSNSAYTPYNWVADTTDKNLYFYLTQEEHTIVVDGDTYKYRWDATLGAFELFSVDVLKQGVRLSGADRIATMSVIAEEGWGGPGGTGSDYVIIASSDNFPDALAASSIAGLYDAPIVLTGTTALSQGSRETIISLSATKAIIIGGTSAISDAVMESIKAIPNMAEVKRISGAGRAETANAIYTAEAGNWGDTAIISSARSPWDALSISAYAAAMEAPIFLADNVAGLIPETATLINAAGFSKVIIVGGSAAVPELVKGQLSAYTGTSIERVSGDNRFETSAAIAKFSVNNSGGKIGYDRLLCATGTAFPDALAGGAFGGRIGAVLILVNDSSDGRYCIDNVVRPNKDSIFTVYALGGDAAVPDSLFADIVAAIK